MSQDHEKRDGNLPPWTPPGINPLPPPNPPPQPAAEAPKEWTAKDEYDANLATRELCQRLGFPIVDGPDPAPDVLAKQEAVAWVITDYGKRVKGVL